jgi:hypothetical protein
MFIVEGGLIYLDKPDNGSLAAYEDGFTLLELCRNHYREAGLDAGELDPRVRQQREVAKHDFRAEFEQHMTGD